MDELNNLVTEYKSIPIEQFFEEMHLTKRQKKERTDQAEKFLEKVLFILSLVSVLNEYSFVDWQDIEERFKQAYLDILEHNNDIDDYTREYIDRISHELTETTRKHVNDEDDYYLSFDRARLIAENEINSLNNYTDYADAVLSGKTKKTWRTMLDKSVRFNHEQAENRTIPIGDLFVVGNSLFRFPKDEQYSPELSEILGCRCSCTYS